MRTTSPRSYGGGSRVHSVRRLTDDIEHDHVTAGLALSAVHSAAEDVFMPRESD